MWKYAHFRLLDENEQYNARGGITFAMFVSNGVVTKLGAALCSRKENFCKEIGRNVARGHAYTLPETVKWTRGEVLNEINKELEESNASDQDAWQMFKRWHREVKDFLN